MPQHIGQGSTNWEDWVATAEKINERTVAFEKLTKETAQNDARTSRMATNRIDGEQKVMNEHERK
jgi:hypothetical protein